MITIYGSQHHDSGVGLSMSCDPWGDPARHNGRHAMDGDGRSE